MTLCYAKASFPYSVVSLTFHSIRIKRGYPSSLFFAENPLKCLHQTAHRGYKSPMPSTTVTNSIESAEGTKTAVKILARPNRKNKPGSSSDSSAVDAKLLRLREAMKSADNGKGIDAFIVPSEDPHQSEYSADCFARRAFISNFTGSAGTAVVTMDKAALWTDGRYFLQASQQLGKDWTLMRAGEEGVPDMADWLTHVLPPKSTVGIDPFLHSIDSARNLHSTLESHDCHLLPVEGPNLVDLAWGQAQPPAPSAPVRIHPLQFAGKDVPSKLSDLRAALKLAGATAIVVSSLDEIAWLFNIRGGDVPHCPVSIAYGIVQLDAAFLFVDEVKVGPTAREHLESAGVSIRPYEELLPAVRSCATAGGKLWMDPGKVSMAVSTAFEEASSQLYSDGSPDRDLDSCPAPIYQPSPISAWKAVKNSEECEGMRAAHIRDGAALAEFWAWLEEEVLQKDRHPTEVEIAEVLEGFRSKKDKFLDTSFDTIAGSGPNGAIIHYRAEADSCRLVDAGHVFLLDSGAQYEDGTTDITRTVHFGQPSAYQKECFTRVLKGHIALDRCTFPEGTPGFVLDVLARTALWQAGLDYRHGTGHGVGAALNVHEGPQGISPRFGNLTALVPGMIVSNEPGYYEDGSFGIRIENLLVVREVGTPNNFGGKQYLGFEKLTFCPIQASMIDLSLLSEDEIGWLNEYHEQVWEKVSPLVSGKALDWLRRNTSAISRD